MHTSNHLYYHGEQELHGYLARKGDAHQARPGVLVVHDWSGRNEFACQKAERLAQMGYVGFAVDMYGSGRLGNTIDEKQTLMHPLISDRSFLRDRMLEGFKTLAALPEVDERRIAVIGFCFGGLCALDLARSGAELSGAVSFHGLLNKPENLPQQTIKARILALHGYDDPMVTPEHVNRFCDEMTEANVDWQVHMYGHTQHAFTNPQANDQSLGTIYNAKAEARSWKSMSDFLEETFEVRSA